MVAQLYAETCETCGGNHNHTQLPLMAQPPISSFDDIIDGLVKKIHAGEDVIMDDALLERTSKDLLKAVKTGFNADLSTLTEADSKLLAELNNNVYVFSGAKTHSQLVEMRDLLKDGKGGIRTFEDFKKEALKLNSDYNVTHLQTEYNMANTSARQAVEWQKIQDQKKALPYLEYDAILDQRTREAHAVLDGTVKRVDHSFWNTYYPPNGWNCRCSVRQLSAQEGAGKLSKEAPPMPDIPDMFRNNVGKTGAIFPDTHPYFEQMTKGAKEASNDAIKRVKAKNSGK